MRFHIRELVDGLTLPDPEDRHVLTATIVGRADLTLTYNLKDFPAESLGEIRNGGSASG